MQGLATNPSVLPSVNAPLPYAICLSKMVAFSSVLAIGTLIASALATPLHFPALDRRALPIGISVPTARTYLSQREWLQSMAHKREFSTPHRSLFHSDGRDAIQLPPVQQELLQALDHQ